MSKYKFLPLLLTYLLPVLYTAIFYFVQIEPNDRSYWQVLILLVGFYLGNVFLWADGKFLYRYYNEMQTMPRQLLTRSIVFLLVYAVLAIFMITSSGNLVGIGLILGMGTTLAIELWQDRQQLETFHKKYLFQLQRTMTLIEVNRMVYGFALFVAAVSIYFLFSRY